MGTNIANPAGQQVVLQDYFNLVGAIAAKVKRRVPSHVDVQDLVQTGMIGLLESSSRYDASRAVEFSTYATSRITGAILDGLRKADTCSRQDRKQARNIEQTKRQLAVNGSEEPSRAQIAEAVGLGLREYDFTLCRLESGKQPTLNAGGRDSAVADEISQIPSREESPFATCSRREDARLLRSYINRLKPRYREILTLSYFEEMGLKEIGRRMGVGEARVSQLHKQAILDLRHILDSEKCPPAPRVSAMVQ